MKSAEIEVNWAMFSDDGLHAAEQKTLVLGVERARERRMRKENIVKVVDQE